MNTALRRVYSLWVFFNFTFWFLLLLPLYLLCIYAKSFKTFAGKLNRFWAKVFLWGAWIPYRIEYRYKPLKNNTYIFCANHTSYMDIVSMGLLFYDNYAFVGKESLAHIPLFGFMFKKLHITVKRENRIEAYRAMLKMRQSLQRHQSLIIFPEGGIVTKHPPKMVAFKDGAFRLAIETQTPIVPVTLPYNWIILPDDDRYLPHRHLLKVVVHPPISTKGLTLEDLPRLKQQTYDIIHEELCHYSVDFIKWEYKLNVNTAHS